METTKKQTPEEIIDEIAEKLAINYVDASLDLSGAKLLDKARYYLPNSTTLNNDKTRKVSKSRNVFILGAGASLNAFPKFFKGGDDAADYIENALGYDRKYKDKEIVKKKWDEIKDKLLQGRQELPETFETRLSILSHFVPTGSIRDEISKLFAYKTLPSRFYEILAHLFKNRFIDAVINFNFDETLDQAINEEISTGQLKRIVSDGECMPYEELVDENLIKIPLYIKPHGTFSEKSSLRFTKEQYIDIPGDIHKLMNEVFLGHPLDKAPEDNDELFEKLNLYVCGFEMESIEFNDLVRSVAESFKKSNSEIEENHPGKYNPDIWFREINIYFFQFNEDDYYIKWRDINPRERLSNREFKDLVKKDKNEGVISINIIKKQELSIGKESFYDWLIQDLKERIFSKFNKDVYYPISTLRHDALLAVLNETIEVERNRNKPKFFTSNKYLISRLIYEILIVICKNRGVIQLEESLKNANRIGMYYSYLLPKLNPENNRILSQIIELFGLKKRAISFGRGMYILENQTTKTTFAICKENFNKSYDEGKVKVELRTNEKIDIGKLVKSVFEGIVEQEEYFENLENGINANLYPNFSNINDHIFKNIGKNNIICTDLALHHIKRVGFEKSSFIFMVSDKGGILKDFDTKIASKNVYTILSENHVKNGKGLLKIGDSTQLPFYDHSRHMVLFTDIDLNNNITFHSGIYFYKKGYSNNVNAVYLDNSDNKNEDNLNNLFKTFLTYWMKAEYYKAFGSLPYIKDEDDIRKLYGIAISNPSSDRLCKIEPKKGDKKSGVNKFIKDLVIKTYDLNNL